MINYLHSIYKVNATTKNRQRAALFDRFAEYTEIIFICGVIVYSSCVIIYLLYPIYMYLFKGKIVPLLPTYFPGIDENTTGGFIALFCYHLLLLMLSSVGISSSDLLFTMLIANTPVMAILIEMEVEQLNDALTSQKVDKLLVESKLKNVLLMHREMTE